jgi:hypothetical protein
MDIIRVATPEEIEAIASKADLTTASQVITFGGKDFAVLRQCMEIDPMFFAEESSHQRKLIFAMNLETTLRLNGAKEYYFNVPVRDEKYIKVLEALGAQPTSQEPELRFKKVL